ncbi:uncharacterized protein LOC135372762 [Ornithodoros turicata]|uniref:uncharacterized protein LOC135372762 n=1 Tax=Ornithodoros turicata TaxID=34597 RepID=UPI003138E6C0
MAASMNLQLNPAKCMTVHISGKQPVGVRETQFHIGPHLIPYLKEFDSFDYLGKPIGFNLLANDTTIQKAIEMGAKLLSSMLAPWQRIDAIKTFVFPSLNFAMRINSCSKGDWQKLDDALRPLIKRTLYLPQNASNDYLYASTNKGCCGIPLAAETSDVAKVDGTFRLLTSRDGIVSDMAREAVTRTVSKRLRSTPMTADIEAYLSGNYNGAFQVTTNELRNIWTVARKASRRLGVSWDLHQDDPIITLGTQSMTSRWRTRIMRTVRKQKDDESAQRLIDLPNQGKVSECVALDRSSTHFIRSGQYTRFCDWRFIHRARLNLLPVNGARVWAGGDKRCRRCGHSNETLPHVLCHCMRQSQALTDRHNKVVQRIKTAAQTRFTVISENKPVGESGLRPDLVLAKGEEAIIIDITCPFDNRKVAFEDARRAKEEKYKPVQEHLKRRYQKVSIEVVVVGALRSWDPANDRLLKRFCAKRYLRTLKRLCISSVLASSRDIYATHISGRSNSV